MGLFTGYTVPVQMRNGPIRGINGKWLVFPTTYPQGYPQLRVGGVDNSPSYPQFPQTYPQVSTGYPQPVDNLPVDNYLSTEPVDNFAVYPVDNSDNPVDCG